MSELIMRVRAEYDSAIKCREEIIKVEQEMKKLNENSSPQEIERLTKRYAELTAKWENSMSFIGKTGAFVKEVFGKIGKSISDSANSTLQLGNTTKSVIDNAQKRLQLENQILSTLEQQRKAEESHRSYLQTGLNRNRRNLQHMEDRLDKKYNGADVSSYSEADRNALNRGRASVEKWSGELDDSNTRLQVYDQLIEEANSRTQKLTHSIDEAKNVYKGFADTVESETPKIFISEEVYRRYDELAARITELKKQIKDLGASDDIDMAQMQGLQDELAKNQEEFYALDEAARHAAEELGGNLADKVSTSLSKLYVLNEEVRKASTSYYDLAEQLEKAKNELVAVEANGDPASISAAREKVDRLTESVQDASRNLSEFKLKQKDALNDIEALKRQFNEPGGTRLAGDMNESMDELSSKAKNLMGTIAGFAGIGIGLNQVKGFFDKAEQWRSYFQDIESSMRVFLGSAEKGAEFTEKLKDYAYYNMFEFSELAQASQQMIAYGHNVESIIPRLDQLSNVAVGTHGSLMELVSAYNRAKAMGVVDARGVQSWATKGVMIRDVLRDLGEQATGTTITFDQLNKVLDKINAEGGMFHNLQKEMMNNLSAEKGQLEDNLSLMFEEVGRQYEGVFIKTLKLQSSMADGYRDVFGYELDEGVKIANAVLDTLAENWQKIATVLKDAVIIYGTYKTVMLASIPIKKAIAMWTNAQALAERLNQQAATREALAKGVETGAEVANSSAKVVNMNTTKQQIATERAHAAATAAEGAAKGKNTAMTVLLSKATRGLTNPYVLAAAAIAGLGYALYAYNRDMMTAEKAQRMLTDISKDHADVVKEEESRERELIGTLRSSTATVLDQVKAYKELVKAKKVYGDYTPEELSKMSDEDIEKLFNQDKIKEGADFYKNQIAALNELVKMYSNNGKVNVGWARDYEEAIDALTETYELGDEVAEKWKNSIGAFTGLGQWARETLKATEGELQKYVSEEVETGLIVGFQKGTANPELQKESLDAFKKFGNDMAEEDAKLRNAQAAFKKAQKDNTEGKIEYSEFRKYYDDLQKIERELPEAKQKIRDAFLQDLTPKFEEAYDKLKELQRKYLNATEEQKIKIKPELDKAQTDYALLQSLLQVANADDPTVTIKIERSIENAMVGYDDLKKIGESYEEIDKAASKYIKNVEGARAEMNRLGTVSAEQAKEIAEKYGLTAEAIETSVGKSEKEIEKELVALNDAYQKAKTQIERDRIQIIIDRKKELLEYIGDLKDRLAKMTGAPYVMTLSIVGQAEGWVKKLLGIRTEGVGSVTGGVISAQIDKLRKRAQQAKEEGTNKETQIGNNNNNATPPTGNKKGGGQDDKKKREAEEIRERLEYNDKLLKLEREASDARANAMIAAIRHEGDRERAERKAQYERSLRELDEQLKATYKEIYDARKKAYERTHKNGHYELTEEGRRGWDFKTLDEVQKLERDIINQFADGELLKTIQEQFGKGNVDVIARPMIDAAELAKKGWKDAGNGIATVFSMQEGILDSEGNKRQVLFTPILPDGSVMTPQEVEKYLHETLEGATDILEADTKGVVISVGDIGFNDDMGGKALHDLHERLIKLPSDKLKEIVNLYKGLQFADDEKKILDFVNQRINAEKELKRIENERAESERAERLRESRIEYMKEYGDYEQKRQAIIEQYDKEIEDAKDDTARMAILMAKRDEELKALTKDQLLDKINWEAIFQDVQNYSVDYLTTIQQQLELAIKDGIENGIDYADLKALGDKLQEVKNTIADKGTGLWGALFGSNGLMGGSWLGSISQARTRQEQLEADAQRKRDDVTAANARVETLRGEREGRQALYETAVFKWGKDSDQALKAQAELDEATRGLSEAEDDAKKAADEQAKAEDAAAEGAKKFTFAMADAIIHGINDNLQSANTMIQEWGIGSDDFQQKFAKFTEGTQYATQAFESFKNGDIFGTIYNAGEAFNSFGESFGLWQNSNRAEVEAANRNLEIATNVNTEAINRLTEEMEKQSPEEAFKSYERAVAAMQANEQNAIQTMLNNAYMYDGGHSLNYDLGDAGGVIEEIFKKLGKQWDGQYDLGGLLFALKAGKLTAQDLSKLYDSQEGQELLTRLGQAIGGAEDEGNYNGMFQNLLDYINDYNKKAYDELLLKFQESVTHISFDSMYDNFVSSLMDMDKSAEDFANDFEGYLRNAIYQAMLAETMKPALEKWYKAFADYVKSGNTLTADEIERLMKTGGSYTYTDEEGKQQTATFQSIAAIRTSAEGIRDQIEALGLYNGKNGEQQSATANSAQSITYEQADAIEGILLGHTILFEQGKEELTLLNVKGEQILLLTTEARDIAADSRDILAGMAIHVEEIRDGVVDTIVPRIKNIDTNLTKVYKLVEAQ